MTVWIMQAGPQGEFADFILNRNMLTVGWTDFGTFADLQGPDQVFDRNSPIRSKAWSRLTPRNFGGSSMLWQSGTLLSCGCSASPSSPLGRLLEITNTAGRQASTRTSAP